MSNTMRSQVQESESTTQGEFSWLLNSLVSNPQNQQQLQQAELSNPQNPQLQQIYDRWNSTEDESFQEIFEGLSNIYQLDNILPDKKLFLSNSDEIESNGRKTKSVGIVNTEPDPKQSEQSKRIRSAELHNKAEKISYERERRNRIKRKMKTLQELIPNCTTSDRASMLDDAVEYLKALKLQVQMMSMAREAMWQTGVQSSSTQQVPQFVPYMPMGFGMGMGLVNMCDYSAGGTGLPLPLVPVPSSSTPLTRFVNPFPPFQVPPPSFMASQAMPAATRPTTTYSTSTKVQPQQIPRDFSYAFNSANQGESSTSQYITKSAMNDNQQVPIPGEKYKVIDSGRITPQQDR